MNISGDLLLGFLLGIVTTLLTLSLNKTLQRLLNKSPCGCLTGILFLIIAIALAVYFDIIQLQL
jgi:predicted PurR-regulated permease PerM